MTWRIQNMQYHSSGCSVILQLSHTLCSSSTFTLSFNLSFDSDASILCFVCFDIRITITCNNVHPRDDHISIAYICDVAMSSRARMILDNNFLIFLFSYKNWEIFQKTSSSKIIIRFSSANPDFLRAMYWTVKSRSISSIWFVLPEKIYIKK
jgi:hypothetical protein